MLYQDFPGTSEPVSVLGLGTWVFGAENWGGAKEEESLAALEEAVRLGVNLIDTAPFYGDGLAEKLVGQFLKKSRDKIFVATKCGVLRQGGRISTNLSPESIRKEIDLSLGRLQCDYVDLYQCHWPDEHTPVEKTMETLMTLQNQKKIRHIGVSNFDVKLLARAVEVAPVKTLQIQYSLLDRFSEKDLLPFCREKNIGVMTYGSIGGGILTGKYSKAPNFGKFDARKMFYKFYEPARFKGVQEALKHLQSFDRPLNQLALNWVRQRPGVMTVLVGCRTLAQAKDNFSALDWNLTPEELRQISEILF